MNNIDEKILIEGVRGGAYESFSLLYNRWVSPLYRFVFSLVKSEDVTQDIVQESFVKIWSNRENLRTGYSFKSYLFTISYHLVLKEWRCKLEHPLMEDYMNYCNSENLSTQPSTEEHIDFDKFIERLKKAKDKLSPRQRQIFEMNKEENIPISEIATSLSISDQSARNQLSAALKIVRKEIGNYTLLLVLFCHL